MKLAVAFLALAFPAVNAAMRGKDNKDSARNVDTMVSLKGVQGEPSAEDMDIIGQALVASYNDVYWQAGHYMTGSHDIEIADNGKKGFVFAVKTPVSRNGAKSILGTALTNECAGMCNKDASSELEVAFCNKILSSESAYLKSTNDCSIKFEHGKSAKGSKHLAPAMTDSAASIETTLSLQGVAGNYASKEDLAVIAKAYVSAYNDVHWDAGHYMADAEIPLSDSTPLELGYSCKRCRNDDSLQEGANTLVLDIITPIIRRDGATPLGQGGYSCKRCRNDDDSLEGASTLVLDDEMTSKAVQVAFCKKLQASFSDNLRATEHCAIVKETVLVSDIGESSA